MNEMNPPPRAAAMEMVSIVDLGVDQASFGIQRAVAVSFAWIVEEATKFGRLRILLCDRLEGPQCRR